MSRVRAILGVFLVVFILAIVVSPYVDLPLTTVDSQQAALWLCSALAVAWAAVPGFCRTAACGQLQASDRQRGTAIHERGLFDLTGALLC
jgi:hypothetical protein